MFQSIFFRGRKVNIRIELVEEPEDEHEFMLVMEDGNGLTLASYMSREEMDRLCDRTLDVLCIHDRMRINRELK